MSLAKDIDKLINDIGSGLSESAIRGRLLTLQEQAEALDTALEKGDAALTECNSALHDACADLERLKADTQAEKLPLHEERLNTVQDGFLKILFEESECPLSYIASKLRVQCEMVRHHKDVLQEREMIRWTGDSTGDFGEGEPTYELTPKGRAYVVKYLCD